MVVRLICYIFIDVFGKEIISLDVLDSLCVSLIFIWVFFVFRFFGWCMGLGGYGVYKGMCYSGGILSLGNF